MRAIEKPLFDMHAVFSLCICSIDDEDLRNRLQAIGPNIIVAASDYDAKARNARLFSIPQFVGNNASVVINVVTKGELKAVYSAHMVGGGKPARTVYDKIRNLAKQCPLCGFGPVATLDHYLPKAKYPLYSVVPSNLVPSCWDCNIGKKTSCASLPGEQAIHPYFDGGHFFSDQWIFAEVEMTKPATVSFFVAPPGTWDPVSKERAAAHFECYGLSARYSVQVADQISALRQELRGLPDEMSRRDHLKQREDSYRSVHANSWQTALHQALANSAWYCREGFGLG